MVWQNKKLFYSTFYAKNWTNYQLLRQNLDKLLTEQAKLEQK